MRLRRFARFNNSSPPRPHVGFIVLVKDSDPWTQYSLCTITEQTGDFDRSLIIIDAGCTDDSMTSVRTALAKIRASFRSVTIVNEPIVDPFAQLAAIAQLAESSGWSHLSILRACDLLVNSQRTKILLEASSDGIPKAVSTHAVYFRGRNSLWIYPNTLTDGSDRSDEYQRIHPVQGTLVRIDALQKEIQVINSATPFIGVLRVPFDRTNLAALQSPMVLSQANAGRFNLLLSVEQRLNALTAEMQPIGGTVTQRNIEQASLEIGRSLGVIFDDEVSPEDVG